MYWPTPSDYVKAVSGYPDVCILDGLLRSGKSKQTTSNKLFLYIGGFSTVFPFEVGGNLYALRCWNKDIGDGKTRYEKIDTYLKQVNLPYFVDFTYIPEGILIDGKKWPITRMKWAEGNTLRDFIDENIKEPSIFLLVANEFLKLFEKLHSNHISHGDLQDGNILLKKNGQDIQIFLIDYDSLFVPDLKGVNSPTQGLPEYQHPLRDNKCDEKMDYFSELVIYLSFVCLSEEPNIWDTVKDKTEKGLLFSKGDFANPDQSNIFKQLGTMSPDIQQLSSTLVEFSKHQSLDRLKPLEDIIPRQDANSHTKQGERFNKEKKYQQALLEFNQALAFEPNFKRALYGCGIANLHLERYTDSTTAFNQAIGLDVNYTEAWYGLSLVYHKEGKNSEAIKILNKITKSIEPSFQPAYDLLNLIRSINTPKTSNRSKNNSNTSSSTKSGSSSSNPSHSKNIGNLIGNYGLLILTCLFGVGAAVSLYFLVIQMNSNALMKSNQVSIEKQLSEQKNSIDSLNLSLSSLNTELSNANKTIKGLNKKNEELNREISRRKSTSTNNQFDLIKLRRDLASNKSRNEVLEEDIRKKEATIQRLEREKSRLTRSRSDSTNDVNLKNKEVVGLKSQILNLQREKRQNESKNVSLQSKNKTLNLEIDKLNSKIATLQSELKALKKDNQEESEEESKNDLVILEPPKVANVSIDNATHASIQLNNLGILAFKRQEYQMAISHFKEAVLADSNHAISHFNLGCTYYEISNYNDALKAFGKVLILNKQFKEAYYNRSLTFYKLGKYYSAKIDVNSAIRLDSKYQRARSLLKQIQARSQ